MFICLFISAPSGVGVVSLVSSTSSSLTVSWAAPSQPNGLVLSYMISLTPISTVGQTTAAGNATIIPLEIRIPEMVLLAVASGLFPATTYSVVLYASTAAGTGMGSPGQLSTQESGEYNSSVLVSQRSFRDQH